ncbi:hypothetical protein [Curtobacterium ammoniigenes]|uniref:hypothetical protein n=1 Tax=Curtobacterium ammoniigenes TaxID=395387 RepID=UPI0012EDF58A|nr:hypothetical protein [Curtobacterium ammoniigenes]
MIEQVGDGTQMRVWSDPEELAALIVLTATGGTVCGWDRNQEGGKPGRADFALMDAAGERCGLLEVTSVADGGSEASMKELRRRTGAFGGDLRDRRSVPGSDFEWVMHVRSGARLKPLWGALDGLLGELEQEIRQHDRFPVHVLAADSTEPSMLDAVTRDPLRGKLFNLGLSALSAYPPADDADRGRLTVVMSSVFPAATPGDITAAVNVELMKRDNRSKLAAASGGRAELFVWLDRGPLLHAAWDAAARDPRNADLPAPTLPAEVTGVWVAPMPRPNATPSSVLSTWWYSTGDALRYQHWSSLSR